MDIAKAVAMLKGYEAKLGAGLTDAEKSQLKKEIDALANAMLQTALPAIKKAEDARKNWLKAFDIVNDAINAAGNTLKPVIAKQKSVAALADKLAKSSRAKKADDATIRNLDYINAWATKLDLVEDLLERANPVMSARGS